MAGIKHAFVSAKEDGADETLVRPSDWNAAHNLDAGASFPGSPAEGDLFYRTDLNKLYAYNGSAWVDLTIEALLTARGDMSFRGASTLERLAKGAEWDILTQGANDPEWGNIAYPIFKGMNQFIMGFGDSGGWQQTLTGGRGATMHQWLYIRADTGDQANDLTGKVVYGGIGFDKDVAGLRPIVGLRLMPHIDPAKSEGWLGCFNNSNTFPTITSPHIGWRLVETTGAANSGILYASSGNGTNGTQTQIKTGIGLYHTTDVMFIFNVTAIYFYLYSGGAWSLAATHTHGVQPTPEKDSLYFGVWDKTTEAVVKELALYMPKVASL